MGFNRTNNVLGTFIISNVFDASVSQTLHVDPYITISWDGTNKQGTYTIPASPDWEWHDINQFKQDGQSTSRRGQTGDVADGAGTYYFSNTGNRIANRDHENWGAHSINSVTKETYDPTFPSYEVVIHTGDVDGQGTYTITIKNPR